MAEFFARGEMGARPIPSRADDRVAAGGAGVSDPLCVRL
jgi:hypothetical protein